MTNALLKTDLTPHVKDLSLRQVLFEDFKSIGKELPIKGGWGYSVEDAIIIDKNDHTVNRNLPFDGIGIEYIIVEKRIYEELIIFRRRDDKFSGIEWKLKRQNTLHVNNKVFDQLIFDVTCFRDDDFEALKQYARLNSHKANFEEEHSKKREMLQCHYRAEYFFDITSFY